MCFLINKKMFPESRQSFANFWLLDGVIIKTGSEFVAKNRKTSEKDVPKNHNKFPKFTFAFKA